MITRSSRSLTDRSLPPLTGADGVTAAPAPLTPPAPLHEPDAGPPNEAGPAYPDPVGGLLHAAVAGRPIEGIARLVTLLEQSQDPREPGAGRRALRPGAPDPHDRGERPPVAPGTADRGPLGG